jgi:hypothetical protein
MNETINRSFLGFNFGLNNRILEIICVLFIVSVISFFIFIRTAKSRPIVRNEGEQIERIDLNKKRLSGKYFWDD